MAGLNKILERLEPCAGKLACTVLRRAAARKGCCLSDFAFVGSQYPITVGETEGFIDLLFYNFKLRNFIVVELKMTEFKPEYVGKMSFYLSAIDEQLKHSDDNPSIGIILCKTKDNIAVEYTLRDSKKPIGVSTYQLLEALPKEIQTGLPTIEQLEKELSEE